MQSTSAPVTMTRRNLFGVAGFLGVELLTSSCAPHHPDFLVSQSDADLMNEIADVIIPPTDTPGGKAAEVGEFARMMVNHWFNEEERKRFVTGIGIFEADVKSRFGREFGKLGAAQKDEAVASVLTPAEASTIAGISEAASRKPANPTGPLAPSLAPRPPFIVLMKRLTILGYYTSQVGASEELEMNLVPGAYQSCGHLEPTMRAGSILGLRPPTFSAS